MPTSVYGLYAADAEWRLSQGGDFDVNLTSSCHLRFTNLAVRLRCRDCRAETHVRQGNFRPEWVTNGNCMAKKRQLDFYRSGGEGWRETSEIQASGRTGNKRLHFIPTWLNHSQVIRTRPCRPPVLNRVGFLNPR